MANALKLIIPLLDDGFSMEDFSEKTGFVDGYLQDINRPSLVDHVFLLYDGLLDTSEKLRRDEHLRSLPTLYSRKTIYISGNPYLIYTFVITSKSVKDIRDGKVPYKKDEFIKICLFWKLTDEFINNLMFDKNEKFIVKDLIVPEEDYRQSWEEEDDF